MKPLSKISTVFAACALLGTPILAQQGGNGGQSGNGVIISYIETLPLQRVSLRELATLNHMRMEEKLARDTYLTLYASTGQSIFNNIAQAEQSHMDLVLYVMNRYGFVDPLMSDAIGVFPDPVFTNLYERMVAYGEQSTLNALWVGAVIEDLDIYDLDQALAQTDNLDVATVWQNLNRGSRNHMRSFYGQLVNLGVDYTGLWLPTSRILEIANSATESQPVDENGVVLP